MPYTVKAHKIKLTWAQRLFTWPWRPWKSHTTIMRKYDKLIAKL